MSTHSLLASCPSKTVSTKLPCETSAIYTCTDMRLSHFLLCASAYARPPLDSGIWCPIRVVGNSFTRRFVPWGFPAQLFFPFVGLCVQLPRSYVEGTALNPVPGWTQELKGYISSYLTSRQVKMGKIVGVNCLRQSAHIAALLCGAP